MNNPDLAADLNRPGAAWPSFRAGLLATGGLAFAGGVFGMLFGIIAISRGFDQGIVVLMSAAVFAGSAQVAVLELWAEPLPYFGLFLAAALVCSRHILMGVTLHDTLSANRKRAPFAVLFVMTDANWVLTRRETRAANRIAFFAGSGVAMYVGWVAGTALGVAAPSILDAQTISGLSIGAALYIAILLCIYFRGHAPARLIAPLISAGVTLLASRYTDAAIAILCGVTAAAMVTLLREWRRA